MGGVEEKITPLREGCVGLTDGEMSTDVLERLESLTEQARRGEIHSFAYAGLRPNGNMITGHDFVYPQGFALLGALSCVHYDLSKFISES